MGCAARVCFHPQVRCRDGTVLRIGAGMHEQALSPGSARTAVVQVDSRQHPPLLLPACALHLSAPVCALASAHMFILISLQP